MEIDTRSNSSFVEAVMKTDWFVDEDFNLYIPDPFGDEWVATGCVPIIEFELDTYWREHKIENSSLPRVPDEIIKSLNLARVDQPLKRWNNRDGFYSA